MKVLIRDYFGSLRERGELDAILPDLLSELGFIVYSRPGRGTTQHGVDIAAIGVDDDGVRKVFLFSLKQGDLTRQIWDGSGGVQGLRASLDEIIDAYIPSRIPKRYQDLQIVICLCFGGDMLEQARAAVTGYIRRNTTPCISFDEWNGDKLADLLLRGVLREEILPKILRSHFQKAVAMVDQPDIAYHHFSTLVRQLCETDLDGRLRVRSARQMYICLWILFVWARDVDNVDAAYRSSELVILYIWNLLRPLVGTRAGVRRPMLSVLQHAIKLHLLIATILLDQKILPHVGKRNALSVAVQTRTHVDVNLQLFDVLGRVATTGLWLQWLAPYEVDMQKKGALQAQVTELGIKGFQLIQNNPCLFLPIMDQQAIEICLFLMLAAQSERNQQDAASWLHEMTERLSLAISIHGRYPCVFTEYRDLIEHPKEQTDEYRKEATSGSTLIPIMAAFLAALGDHASTNRLVELKASALEHCNLQLWLPDTTSEDKLYIGGTDHGTALCELPLSESCNDLLDTIRDACERVDGFATLSAHVTGYWPIILTACRHYRFPVPPQFWIKMLRADGSSTPEAQTEPSSL